MLLAAVVGGLGLSGPLLGPAFALTHFADARLQADPRRRMLAHLGRLPDAVAPKAVADGTPMDVEFDRVVFGYDDRATARARAQGWRRTHADGGVGVGRIS
ncbi:hypothetical protein [Actinocorallia sp. A-T 12471]|uniref:hypothetical protein n=1 Tax=Actinocorallia sp. A-T 12471 TaxID=3089813 RepID=UPI0029CECB56|nr:hypothetical protein [Actinocorallia sp. A-T 12471]MDX6744852.1 hypothetical protein [Actinocorallia sp. A-T 12471]